MSIVLPVLMLLLTVGALVTVITSDDENIRYLPKLVWILLIVFLPLAGAIIWFAVGRHWRGARPEAVGFGDPRRERARRVEVVASTPDDDEAAIEAEIRYHEKQAEIRRLEAEVARKRAET